MRNAKNKKGGEKSHRLFITSNNTQLMVALYGVPKGIRTPVTAVKGQCPRPLDDGDLKLFSFVSWWS